MTRRFRVSSVLRHASTYRDRRLNASQERRAMEDNLVSASPGAGRVVFVISFFLRTIPFSFHSPIRGMGSVPAWLSFSSLDYAGDFCTQGLGLPPTAIG